MQDSCSEFDNMTLWASLFAETGKPMLLEDCHNSDMQDPCPQAMVCPETATCPYNLWRTSGDIGPSWGSIFNNLQLMLPWLGEPPLSRPGRWAVCVPLSLALQSRLPRSLPLTNSVCARACVRQYPDMMQVGQMGCGKDCNSNLQEDRAHFGGKLISTAGYPLSLGTCEVIQCCVRFEMKLFVS